tara:strand:- start:1055 stop:1204 length:150 start_codon:yes stop_codon:yes gene_type:complete
MTEDIVRNIEFYQNEQIRMMKEFVNNLEKLTEQFQEVVKQMKEKDIKFK